MKKINTKSILLALGILAIFAVGFVALPKNAAAYTDFSYGQQVSGDYYGGGADEPARNPKPFVSSISPRSSNLGVGTKTVTITGSGFTPSSVARINAVNRNATFIDSSHLLVQITGNDIAQYQTNGGFYINVFNGAPGGGYSNAAFFTVVETVSTTPTNTNQNGYNNGTNYQNNTNAPDNFVDTVPMNNAQNSNNPNENYSNLASNAIFGGNTFLPSGLIQWVLFAIIILLIVVLARKLFGAEKNYHASPMKHA